jgi:hypothetical protein
MNLSSSPRPSEIMPACRRALLKCALFICLLGTMISSGCSSMNKPAEASFASVIIINQTPDTIRQAAIGVFQDNGYQMMPQADGSLVFEREATRREQIDYAGFAGTQQGEKVDMRVRVNITVKDPGAYWLECKAYAVANPGQGVFEQSTPLFDFQGKPYQKLLNQVAARLAAAAPAQ